MSIPDVQKAWISERKGTPAQSLKLRTDWPVSKLEVGEVLVKVQAAALNPVGYKMMRMIPDLLGKRPYVPEHDFSGVVVDSNGSTEYKNGEDVYGWIRFAMQLKTKEGALAEYIRIPAVNITKRPPNISAIQAAGVTLAGLTALQGLNDGKLEEGQTVFIYGGSTAVGHYAIQLAKIRGAKVVAAASGKNEELVRKLGADEFIDYKSVGPIHTYLAQNPPPTKYNLVFDAYGLFEPSLYTHSRPYLAPNGVFVSVGPQPNGFNIKTISQGLRLVGAMILPSFITGIRPQFKLVLIENKVEDTQFLRRHLENGSLKTAIDSVFEFEDVLKAYERILTSRATGKVTVKVDPSLLSM